MIVYLAIWLVEISQGQSLTRKKKRERLVSYYHVIQNKNEEELDQYVQQGKNNKRTLVKI